MCHACDSWFTQISFRLSFKILIIQFDKLQQKAFFSIGISLTVMKPGRQQPLKASEEDKEELQEVGEIPADP